MTIFELLEVIYNNKNKKLNDDLIAQFKYPFLILLFADN